jgi:biopolymer transport protein TolR
MAMSTGGGGNGRAPMSEINVTPLVDVMLVLLIIFMVTAPMLTAGVEVDLPRADADHMAIEDEKLLLIIDEEQHIFLRAVGTEDATSERFEVQFADLQDRLATNALIRANHELYVQADQSVSYGFVAQVLAIARQAGVEQLGLVTDPRGEGPPTPLPPGLPTAPVPTPAP